MPAFGLSCTCITASSGPRAFDLRDIAGVLGIKIGDEKCLDGRRDDNGRQLPALVVTFSILRFQVPSKQNTRRFILASTSISIATAHMLARRSSVQFR